MREPDEPNQMNDSNPTSDSRPDPRQMPDDDFSLSPDLQADEAAWARLRPTNPQIDRERLFYQAGWDAAQAAPHVGRARVSRVVWPIALGGMTAVAATLLGMLVVRPEPGIVERVVYVQANPDEHSTVAARAFAQSNAGANAPDSAADGGEPSVWTVGHLLQASAAGSSQLASDLLPADVKTPVSNLAPLDEPVVLSSRSFDSLLDERSLGANGLTLPDCQSPHALESSHDL